jgi:hypothetical protein
MIELVAMSPAQAMRCALGRPSWLQRSWPGALLAIRTYIRSSLNVRFHRLPRPQLFQRALQHSTNQPVDCSFVQSLLPARAE